MWILVVLIGGIAEARAQSEHGQAYLVSGPGRFAEDGIGFVAFGGEYISTIGVGVAGELAWLTGARPDVRGGPTRSTPIGSIHLLIPLNRPSDSPRVRPFLLVGTGFLGNAIGDNYTALVFGGGANVWLMKRVGMRFDVRVPLGYEDVGGVIGTMGVTVR